MSKIICITKFTLDPFADGGSKRSAQIREILASNDISYSEANLSLPKKTSILKLAQWSWRAIGLIQQYYPKRFIRSISHFLELVKYYALRIPVFYDRYKGQDIVFLWEKTTDLDMLYLLKATHCPVVGMPHNLESLVSSNSIKRLDEEIEALAKCDALFSISKEETWLLRVLGGNAFYLPYYPPKEAESFLLSIRANRETRRHNTRKKYALLGSATNKPTKDGMQSLIAFAEKQDLPFDLLIAGYGTEALKTHNNKDLTLLGSLSQDELKRLLLEIDAVLIYQPPTTGALTRIPEMLLAGIPVFANFDAARSFHDTPGVYVYHTIEGLFGMLSSFETCQTDCFLKNDIANRIFSDWLKNITKH